MSTGPSHRCASSGHAFLTGLLSAALLVALGQAAAAADVEPISAAATASIAVPSPETAPAIPDSELTGRDIYERVLRNRFDAYTQHSSLVSGDRGGNSQETRLRMSFKNFRGADRKPLDGVLLSKTLVKYEHPFELRHTGYLVINNLDRPNDQFVYLATHRRVRRVNLRGEAVFGTDFSFEDVVPRELEDAAYSRVEDEVLNGVPVFVVDAVPKDLMRSEYSRFRIYVEKERFIPLRTRYWDDREVEVKELLVERDSITRVADVWVPMRTKMTNLRQESFTRLEVTELVPNPDLPVTTFDLRRLETH